MANWTEKQITDTSVLDVLGAQLKELQQTHVDNFKTETEELFKVDLEQELKIKELKNELTKSSLYFTDLIKQQEINLIELEKKNNIKLIILSLIIGVIACLTIRF